MVMLIMLLKLMKREYITELIIEENKLSEVKKMKTKILILASNPQGTNSLELQKEIRDLTEVIKRSPDRDRFIIETKLAVRPQDLQSALLEVKPRIVHFCGHGEGERGLVIENNSGQTHLVSTEALADLFRHFSQQVECVVLNACYTQVQAEEIVKHINFVIGMRQPILDGSAIAFSAGFYGALGAGQSITKAYDFGCNRIHLDSDSASSQRNAAPISGKKASSKAIPEHLIPILFVNKNPTKIERSEELSTMETESAAKGNSISFGDSATVGGDIVGGNQTKHTIYNSEKSPSDFSQAELLELLKELKFCIKQASLDEDERDMATGQIAGAISQAKQTNPENIGVKKDKIGAYLQETKTILDRVKDVGEIGAKAFPILKKITAIIGLSVL